MFFNSKAMFQKRIGILLCMLLITGLLFAQNFPAKPNPPRLVNDYTQLLTPDQRSHLEEILVAYDDSTSIQIAVVIVPSLNGSNVDDYAIELARQWGVGNKKTNNGVLVLMSMDPKKREVFIAPGYGLEGALPDITCKQIIESEMIPAFKEGNYYRGLAQGTGAIIEASRGEYKAPAGYRNRGGGSDGGTIFFLIILMVIIFIIIGRKGGGGGGGDAMTRRGHRHLNTPPFLFFPPIGGGGGGGGGWSGGGGGGFGGFGGGGFGGGGAGGSW